MKWGIGGALEAGFQEKLRIVKLRINRHIGAKGQRHKVTQDLSCALATKANRDKDRRHKGIK